MGASEPISQLRTLSPERVFAGMVELLRGRMGADVVWMQYEGRDGRVRLLQSPDVFDSPPLEWPRSACRAALRLESAVFEKHIDVAKVVPRSEEHTSELQSRPHLVCRLLLEKKKLI